MRSACFRPRPAFRRRSTSAGIRIGLPICEDIWFDRCSVALSRQGAELLLVPNGSPFEVEKFGQRLELARLRTSESGLPLMYVNQVGGQGRARSSTADRLS
jgi:NAD+ synthase